MRIGIGLCIFIAIAVFGLFTFGSTSPYFIVGICTISAAAVIAVGILMIYSPKKRRPPEDDSEKEE